MMDKIFISYSSKDKARVRRINNILIEHGLETWFDETDISQGENWSRKIIEAINQSRFFLACISKNSLGAIESGQPVRKELEQALAQLPQKPPGFLLPALLDDVDIPNLSVGFYNLADYSFFPLDTEEDITNFAKQTKADLTRELRAGRRKFRKGKPSYPDIERIKLQEHREFELLLSSIKDKLCALLIGPLFGTVMKDGRERQINDVVDENLKYNWDEERLDYKHDGLYLLNSTLTPEDYDNEIELRRDLRKAYQELIPGDIYDKLAKIPLRLLVNCSCDTFLIDAFRKEDPRCNFFYYSAKEKKIKSDRKDGAFESDSATIFNVYGNVKDSDSLILNHDMFFTFLSVIFSEQNSLSKNLDDLLNKKKTKRFLMMGFDMNSWYVPQMIYRINAFGLGNENTFRQRKGLTDWAQDLKRHDHLDPFPLDMRAYKETSSEILSAIYNNFQTKDESQGEPKKLSKEQMIINDWKEKILQDIELEVIFKDLIRNQSKVGYKGHEVYAYRRRHNENERKWREKEIGEMAYQNTKDELVVWLLTELDGLMN